MSPRIATNTSKPPKMTSPLEQTAKKIQKQEETFASELKHSMGPPIAKPIKSQKKPSRMRDFFKSLDSKEDFKRKGIKMDEERHKERVAKYQDVLCDAYMCQLDSIVLGQHKDSEYLSTCLQLLYRTNVNVLCNKSLHGKPYINRKTKMKTVNSPLSPLKKRAIYQLFRERVTLSGTNVEKRKSNEYIRDKLTNALSYLKSKLGGRTGTHIA